ncbi:MAG TPA: preprotein translocase subunit SecY [Candidatus Pacearchaeota archaeon]|nr:preprotein translocase subunit SecY [Candidatus Pacearchaeota archaeon]HOK94059.1 preprotein translocase subunit SecY [Candidatus Pacearchaeota archaeon]HPO75130.1 preprotein translocase subunit SecY [Candidatus Pacearchaeota archaeon]
MDFSKFTAIFKSRDLRNKILFVVAMMVVFRIAANIPIPGIDRSKLIEFFQTNQFFGLMNVFTGGALENLSIVMLGLGPYITGTIIMQLLTLIFPNLKEMYQESGEQGRRKFNQYARILTVPLAAIQSFAMLRLLQKQGVFGEVTGLNLIVSIITVTAGSVFLMWIGELITEKGIGNGISLLIFAGIISGVPSSIRQIILTWDPSQLPSYVLFFIAAILITIGVVIVTQARRNVPVSYAKRVRGNKMYGGVQTYLPMMINPAGVIPIIFALSIMMLPGMFGSVFADSSVNWLSTLANFLNNIFKNSWIYGICYFILVVLFTYFYTAVTFDPENIAENLQKMGGFVPGLRPGKQTADFLRTILNRVLLVGAVFLGLIAVMPSIIQGITGITSFSFAIGGTSLLIIVSVVLETSKQIQSQLEMREYE